MKTLNFSDFLIRRESLLDITSSLPPLPLRPDERETHVTSLHVTNLTCADLSDEGRLPWTGSWGAGNGTGSGQVPASALYRVTVTLSGVPAEAELSSWETSSGRFLGSDERRGMYSHEAMMIGNLIATLLLVGVSCRDRSNQVTPLLAALAFLTFVSHAASFSLHSALDRRGAASGSLRVAVVVFDSLRAGALRSTVLLLANGLGTRLLCPPVDILAPVALGAAYTVALSACASARLHGDAALLQAAFAFAAFCLDAGAAGATLGRCLATARDGGDESGRLDWFSAAMRGHVVVGCLWTALEVAARFDPCCAWVWGFLPPLFWHLVQFSFLMSSLFVHSAVAVKQRAFFPPLRTFLNI